MATKVTNGQVAQALTDARVATGQDGARLHHAIRTVCNLKLVFVSEISHSICVGHVVMKTEKTETTDNGELL
jgi:hypothetical protein